MYVLPMEKHALDLVTSTCIMSCNVLVTLVPSPSLTYLEAICEANLRGLSFFTKAVYGTHECALSERARSRCAYESW
jgi:hypothetical protein